MFHIRRNKNKPLESRNIIIRIVFGCIMVAFISLSATLFTTIAWFITPAGNTDNQAIDGEIGLREYFYDGDGSQERPYEIVLPNHFYNLTRLQNLGLFPEKQFFQIGHDFGGDIGLQCIDPSVPKGQDGYYVSYLDMESYSNTHTVLPIGNESTPFCGSFNGNNFPIYKLKVVGNPEDIGVFGYIDYRGAVANLILDQPEIRSIGYNDLTKQDDLFDASIDNIFIDPAEVDESYKSPYLATDVSLDYIETGVLSTIHNLKKNTGSTSFSEINQTGNFDPETKEMRGYFLPTFPEVENDPFTYSIASSSPVIKKTKRTIDGNQKEVMVVDFSSLSTSSYFNDPSLNKSIDCRIYLIAKLMLNGYSYSRVVQSYKVDIYSNYTEWEDGGYSMVVQCDYMGEEATNYNHGNNIGFIAGHVDGSLQDCYVYKPHFVFNQNGLHAISTETDTGLVGEIGDSVRSEISPDLDLMINGEVGVMNSSLIYSLIRRDFEGGENTIAGSTVWADESTKAKYIAYAKERDSDTVDEIVGSEKEQFDLYKEFLRTDNSSPKKYYVTSAGEQGDLPIGIGNSYVVPAEASERKTELNSIDFLWNKVIANDAEDKRGLGVFKIVTAKNDTAANGEYGKYWRDNIGQSSIINGSEKTKVYFSTAESQGNDDFSPLRMVTLPSWSDVGSFDYPFSRQFNYVFELDLAGPQKRGMNYMFNTDSPFLTNYLKSVLIDKYGKTVAPNTPRFGFMFRSSKNELLNSLSSYIKVGVPNGSAAKKVSYQYEDDNGVLQTEYYPEKSIVFHIDNPNGANVSVVGCDNDISIYSLGDPKSASGTVTKFRTMKSKNENVAYNHRFFTYQYGDEVDNGGNIVTPEGTTGTVAMEQPDDMKDNGVLYGHIFKLPQGDYCIGSASGQAKIYFLAVQGQNNAEIGTPDVATSGKKIDRVDFLLEEPTKTASGIVSAAEEPTDPTAIDWWDKKPLNVPLRVAEVSFRGLFDNTEGVFQVDIEEYKVDPEDEGETPTPCLKFIFNQEDETNTREIYALCKKASPRLYFNDVAKTLSPATYSTE